MTGADDAEPMAEAAAILGPSEEILGAGYFSLADLVGARMLGAAVGTLAADLVSSDPLGDALGAVVGGRYATHAAAEQQGVTIRLLVAITADTIHVLNGDTGGRLRTEVDSFRRDAVAIEVRKSGLSRILTLTDTASGHSLELHGSVSWLAAQAKGDKVVLELLQD